MGLGLGPCLCDRVRLYACVSAHHVHALTTAAAVRRRAQVPELQRTIDQLQEQAAKVPSLLAKTARLQTAVQQARDLRAMVSELEADAAKVRELQAAVEELRPLAASLHAAKKEFRRVRKDAMSADQLQQQQLQAYGGDAERAADLKKVRGSWRLDGGWRLGF